MSKMSELDAAARELHRCGDALIALSTTLMEIFSSGDNSEAEASAVQEPVPQKPVVTLEQVRSLLAEKSAAGHRADVQALIQKYGATKLSEIAPEVYADLLAEAEVL